MTLGVNSSPALAQGVAGATQATGLHIYTPFQPGGGLVIGVAVTGRTRGSCFATSAAAPNRPDAYRCTASNAILDPCFAPLNDQTSLACSRDPWSANAILLTRSGPLPFNARLSAADPDYAQAMPWALELANGQRCTRMTGATAPVAGLRINYGCPGGGVVAGGIDRTLPL
ncbi:hypothetical protein [Deinococcus apachensis]|uniref:hypothetical protein n=1 Tax=Deinococcus apachensis TaxID=309886 RepID=UPI0003655B19|nr:hypothetical protein [Deinococcus apachensis]